jgi:hypothetical protein
VRGFPSVPIGVVKLVAVGLSTVGRWPVVRGFPSTPTGLVMLVPVPLSLTGVGSGAVGCCAKATPVSVTVDAIANDVIQAVRVMVVNLPGYAGYLSFASPQDAMEDTIATYRLDRTKGQDVSLYLGVEKAGMVVQLQAWFGDLGLPVLALGGYASTTYASRSGNSSCMRAFDVTADRFLYATWLFGISCAETSR